MLGFTVSEGTELYFLLLLIVTQLRVCSKKKAVGVLPYGQHYSLIPVTQEAREATIQAWRISPVIAKNVPLGSNFFLLVSKSL